MADKQIRPFNEWLIDQRTGALNLELSVGLNSLAKAVETTGKAGSLTLKLTLKPAGKDTAGALVVSDVVTLKAPESHPEVFFFVDDDDNLVRSNPRQLPMGGLLEVAEQSGALKEVR